jgi:PAS domain S-box-containing protein
MIKLASKPNIDQKLLTLLVTSIEDYAIFVTDPRGYIVSWNKGAERIKGYRESEIIGKHISVFYTKADVDKNEPQRDLNAALKNGSYENEGWRVHKNGSIFWANAVFTPLFEEDQKLLGFANVTRDITERKKTDDKRTEQYIDLEKQATANYEKALAAEVHYRKLIENSYDGIALFDKNFYVYYRSPSAQRITGWEKEDREGLYLDDIIHPDDRTMVSGLCLKILNEPEEPVICSYRIRHKQGHYIWLECAFNNKLSDPDMGAIVCNFRDITEKKESDLILQKTINELSAYRDALDESAIVAITDQKGVIKHVNDYFCRISKYSREELLGQDHRIINSTYHDKAFIADLWRTIANGKTWKGELKNKAKDGSYYWVDTTIVPFLNEFGKPYQYVAIRSDISERKEAESEIERTVKELSAYKYALDVSAIVAITDQKGIIKHVNDNFCRISKYNRDELLGQDHRIINSSYHDKSFIADLWRTIATGKIWKGELKNKAKDGTYYWVDTTIVPFLNEQGKPYQYVAIRSDITDRKEAESEILRTVKELSAYKYALDESAIVAITDQKGIIKHVNDNFCRISKYSRKELLGQDHRIINSSYHPKSFITELWRTIANGKIWRGELKNKAKDGTYYWVDTTIVPFLNEQGKPYQYLAIRSDITERKNSETHLKELNESLRSHARELADSNAELEQFAYVASHDLQEPLRMVTGFLTQLEKKYQDVIDEKGKQYIFFAVDGSKRMRQIILDLLEYSRAGKTVSGLERVDLNKFMDEMRVLYRKQLDSGAQIFNDELPEVICYKTSLWQVLQNLVGNALKYHKKDVAPVVTVSCSVANTHWQFCVEDNGIGIEPEYFDKIFIIFQRLHRKGEYSGTGIGLAIAKKLVENLGGKIWVDSAKNVGTKFYFTILKIETL